MNYIPLPVDRRITLGRKPTCDVVINSVMVSNVHCMIKLTSRIPGTVVASVFDCSKNGTYVERNASNNPYGAVTSASNSGTRTSPKCVKLSKGECEDVRIGDVIMLLAPGHECNDEYKYRLVSSKDGKCFLKLLCRLRRSGEGVAGAKRCGSADGFTDPVKKRRLHGDVDLAKSVLISKPFADAKTSAAVGEVEEDMERCPTCRKLFHVSVLPSHCPICQEAGMEQSTSDHLDTVTMEECSSCQKMLPLANLASHHEVCEGTKAKKDPDSFGECPYCSAILAVTELIEHSVACRKDKLSKVMSVHFTSSTGGEEVEVDGSKRLVCAEYSNGVIPLSERDGVWNVPLVDGAKGATAGGMLELEQCPFCLEDFPVCEMPTHCSLCTTKSKCDIKEQCQHCLKVFPLAELIYHATVCSQRKDPALCDVEELCQHCLKVFPLDELINHATNCSQRRDPGSLCDVKEQCQNCLEVFPLTELIHHATNCSQGRDLGSLSGIEEQCQHCLEVFPLAELIHHATNCSQRRDLGSLVGEPLEKCMHCFKDFPLSKMVEHCNKCTGDAMGSRERFKNFIPSVHDLDCTTLSVLTPTQRTAVDYVTQRSQADSESLYPRLKKRVNRLGYSEKDLKQTLQWIRRDAPIIIHLNLDRCLHFLVKDTHYRNLFETGKGGGGDCQKARKIWENRIFNKSYTADVSAFDRVKYGVLNIVGDPRGVQCCSGYGNSFLQLKKVRLRTTFASADTSNSNVKLSCCEHYGNVLYEYNDSELKAVLDVATQRKSFLRSVVISQYKEVQIHGPVSLSENVDCIVVHEQHKSNSAMRSMLDKFVDKNKCNLIWMEPIESIDYPSFGPIPSSRK